MTEQKFTEFIKKKIVEYVNSHLDKSDNKKITEADVFIVWACKTLQNKKIKYRISRNVLYLQSLSRGTVFLLARAGQWGCFGFDSI